MHPLFLGMLLLLPLTACSGPEPASPAEAIPTDELALAVNRTCVEGQQRQANHGRKASQTTMLQGWKAVEEGKDADALLFFLNATLVGPERPDAYWGLGVAAGMTGYPLATVDACFERAIATIPDEPGVFADYGRTLEERDRFARAIVLFNRALELDPDFREAHVGLARSYLALGDQAKAEPHVEWLVAHSNAEAPRL